MSELSKEEVKIWFQRLTDGFNTREDWIKNLWSPCTEYVAGNFKNLPSKFIDKGKARVVPNRPFNLRETLMSLLFHRDPRLSVKTPDISKGLKELLPDYGFIWEGILKEVWRLGKYFEEFKLAIDDSIVCGTGFVKIGFGLDDTAYPIVKGEKVKLATEEEIRKGHLEFDKDFLSKLPWIKYVPIEDLMFDPMGSRMDHKRWAMHMVVKRYSDIMSDKKLNKDGKLPAPRAFKYDAAFSPMVKNSNQAELRDGEKRLPDEDAPVILYEIYDRKENRKIVLADGYDIELSVEDNPAEGLGGFPFRMFKLIDIRNNFYGQPVIKYMEEALIEESEIRTGFLDYAYRAKPKIIIGKTLTEEQMRDIESNEPLVVVQGMTKEDISSYTPSPMPADSYRMLNDLRQDHQELIAFTSNVQGREFGQRTTATEVEHIAQYAQLKSSIKSDAVDAFVKECMEAVVTIIQTNGKDIPLYVSELNPRTREVVRRKYTIEEVEQQVGIEVLTGSASIEYNAMKRQDEMQFYGITKGDPSVNPMAMFKRLCREGFKMREEEINELQAQPAVVPPIGGQTTPNGISQVGAASMGELLSAKMGARAPQP